jgi:hypothetical protein
MGHGELQLLTRQIGICVSELNKVIIFINNDIMILGKKFEVQLKFGDFKYGAYN